MNTNMGCCGQREIAHFAALADLHPRSTYAGKRARAQLALAMIGTRARALGDLGTLAKVERGLAQLGTAGADAVRQAAVGTAVARIRAAREQRDASGAVRDALFASGAATVRSQVETVLTGIRTALGLVEAAVNAEATAERDRAAREGRDPNYTARDVVKAVQWIKWFLGGAFPTDVAENDLRLLGSIIGTAVPLITAALEGARFQAQQARNIGLSNALAGVIAYLGPVQSAVQAAVAALPPPVAPVTPPAPPTDGGWTIGPTTGIRCPDGQVSTVYGCRPPCPTGTYQDRSGCVPFSRPIGPDGRPIDYVVCPDGSRASSAARCPGAAPKSSSALLALPVAALVWYLIK